ncbi:hydrolase [Wenjunlia vitaminophila]|uniref:Hydrolase n=1 Tax=Wenjunlia vitaminophila TaxID=76728 RepID=A0A0T6LVI3_WENVI|nr:alpha/beta hydrolase [Wenjunlia vitaminophila]KRV50086.1 hydrolase [Wenjunlia vitaminophila]
MVRQIDVMGADGVRLTAWEFGAGRGATDGGRRDRPGLLLLHDLMGRASTWADNTARWLAPRFRTVAVDQRGHGHSEKPAGPYDRGSYVADVEAVVEALGLAPAVLVGHAMGGLTAWQLAARRPDLVRGLVVSETKASTLGEDGQRRWLDWFKSWPLPFDSLDAVRRWFSEDDPTLERPSPGRGDYFVEVMEERADGYWPEFSFDHMMLSLEPWAFESHWDDLALVHCPTLVVRGLDGALGRAEAQEMVRALPDGHYAEVPDCGHIVHCERPEGWRQAVEPFLAGLGR